MRAKSFRWCMLIGALALIGVAVYYLFNFVVLSIALGNSGVQEYLQSLIRALWLAFACQTLLIGLLYLLVAFRPQAISREVIVLSGLLQMAEAVLLFSFAGSKVLAMVLVAAAVFVLIGSLLWPKRIPLAAATPEPAASATAAPDAPR